MIRTLRLMLNLVVLGFCIGRAYAEIERQFKRPHPARTVRTID
jgi:hypothetical protein